MSFVPSKLFTSKDGAGNEIEITKTSMGSVRVQVFNEKTTTSGVILLSREEATRLKEILE